MRGDRENRPHVAQPNDPALIVVRGPKGIGKSDLVRRWTTNRPQTATLWLHVTPPRNSHNFWMRVISQVHARGWITDQVLYAAISRATAPDANIRDITSDILAEIPATPLLVIDDLHSAISEELYCEILRDLAHFLRECERLRAVIVESHPSPLEDLGLPPYLLLSDAHMPPVAFLGKSRRALAPVPGLHTLVQDPARLLTVCLAAVPHDLDAEVAAAATGHDGDEILAILTRWRLGSTRVGARGTRFVFYDDVRAEALVELRRTWPQELTAAARRLTALYRARGERELAFEFTLLTEDSDLMTRVGLRMTPFPMQFSPRMFELLTQLPLAEVRRSPLLSLLIATISQRFPRTDMSAIELYRHAAVSARSAAHGLDPSTRLILLGVESFALRHSGNVRGSVTAALLFTEHALALMRGRTIDNDLAHAFGHFAYQSAIALIAGSEYEAASSLLYQLAEFCLAHDITYRRRAAHAALSYLEALTGHTYASASLAPSADVADAPALQESRSYPAFIDASAVIRAGLTADFAAMQQKLAEFRTRPHDMHWDVLLFGEVLLDLAAGNVGAARVRFDTAIESHNAATVPTFTARRVSYLRWILVLFGENPRLLAATGIRAADDPISLAFSAGRDIDQGDTDGAATKLSRAATAARTPLQQHVVFTLLARLGAITGDQESTQHAASILLVLARTHHLRLAFALLTRDERTRILASLAAPSELRAAFEKTRPLAQEHSAATAPVLTARQLVIIRALADMGSRQEVAKRLFLSPGTVKAHLRAIYKKLDAHSEAEALYKAAALGLLQQP